MGLNTAQLNMFAAGMADLQMSRNPLAQEVVLIFNESGRDHYQDAILTETARVKKLAVIKKDADMNYVQQIGDLLLEDVDAIPWVVSVTVTDLPRIPRLDDQILIEGLRYTISLVKPANRAIDSILLLSIYPDRTDEEELDIFNIEVLEDGCLDVLYGGNPRFYSFEKLSKEEVVSRAFPFVTSYIKSDTPTGILYIYDEEGDVKSKEFGV